MSKDNPQEGVVLMNIDADKLLFETHRTVTRLETVLLGTEDNKETGLCQRIYNLEKDYKKFKANVILAFGVLVGSGALTVGIINVL